MKHNSLEGQLSETRSLLQAMCDRVDQSLLILRKHLDTRNPDDLTRIVLLDNEIDKIESSIDEQILYIFATQQPLGLDLRQAYASAKIAHQIERIGDAAESLARQLSNEDALKLDTEKLVARMFDASLKIFKLTYRAMFEGEVSGIAEIYGYDDQVDELHRQLFSKAKILLSLELEQAEVEGALQLISIGNRLEKIADICCNWAEQVDFMYHGMQRRIIQKQSKKIIISDRHGGILAGIVAGEVASYLTAGVQITAATHSSWEGKAHLGTLGQELVEKAGLKLDIFPVISTENVDWDRSILLINIGAAMSQNLHPTAARLRSHKTWCVNWSSPRFNEDEIDLLAHDKPTEKALDADLLKTTSTKLFALAERAKGLESILSRL